MSEKQKGEAKTARIPIKVVPVAPLKKPDWIRVKAGNSAARFGEVKGILRDIGIPVVKIDRGGQITYHGPGQIVGYLLLDLKRRGLTVKGLVNRMEQAVIDLLAQYGIAASRLEGAPGVYVQGAKIAALGLKVKNGCTYHGLSLNVAMDLAPFAAINPCGYADMAVTQLSAFVTDPDLESVGASLARQLSAQL